MNDEPAPGQSWCEALFHAHARGLILYGRALGLSHGEAEDVVQETFLALLKLPAPPDEPGRYLLRAFRNRSVNFRRSLWRRVAREFEARNWFESADAADASDPATAVAMRCLATLPVEQREVIVLKIWHGHTFQAIADLLDLSPNTIAGRYRYGLQRLRTCLEKRQRNLNALDAFHEPDELTERLGEPLAFLDAARSVPHP